MRVAVQMGFVQPYGAHQLQQCVFPLHSIGIQAVYVPRFTQNLPHGLTRVQTGVRVLEHHLYLSAQFFKPGFGQLFQFQPVDFDRAGLVFLQPQHHFGQRSFAAAGLAHQA